MAKAACNLSEPVFDSNQNRLSQEPQTGTCAGKPPRAVPKGAEPAAGMPKMLF